MLYVCACVNVKMKLTEGVFIKSLPLLVQHRSGQLCGSHVARHSVFSGQEKHSGKIFKSVIVFQFITVNVCAEASLNRD